MLQKQGLCQIADFDVETGVRDLVNPIAAIGSFYCPAVSRTNAPFSKEYGIRSRSIHPSSAIAVGMHCQILFGVDCTTLMPATLRSFGPGRRRWPGRSQKTSRLQRASCQI